jgi:hypothetical protein
LCIINLNNKFKITEIISDYSEKIKGPKFFLIDYYTLNNMKSFGIESNYNYFFFEQFQNTYETRSSEKIYNNITIINQQKRDLSKIGRAFILFNITYDDIYFKVQKYNYSIFKDNDF